MFIKGEKETEKFCQILVHMMNVNQRAKEANNEKKKKEPPN
jgi:hypothetical protein